MANEKKKGKSTADYYQLNTRAVDELVSANPENTPHYSQAELEKYKSGKLKKFRIPEAVKAVFIKFWFYGAVCFFVVMGLGLYLVNQWDLFFVIAVVMGMVTDLLVNRFLRFTENMPGGSARWMMVTKRGMAGFVMNILYGFVVLFVVVTLYSVLNAWLQTGGEGNTLGVEPILFGLFATGADMLFIGMKRMLMNIVADARKK